MTEAERLFEQRRKKSALNWLQIMFALKYRGMEGMKRKILELTIKK